MDRDQNAELRIVYCSNRYVPAHGGLEVFLKNVACAMARKHHVTVVSVCHDDRSFVESLVSPPIVDRVTPDGGGLPSVVPVRLSPLSRFAARFLRAEPSILSLAPRERYYTIRSRFTLYAAYLMRHAMKPHVDGADIVHSFGPWEVSHSVARLRPTAPHIVTGFLHTGFWADDAFSLQHYLSCDQVIALVQAECDDYVRLGVPRNSVSVVPIPMTEPEAGSRQTSRCCKSANRQPFVLFLGVKREYKGIEILLDATTLVWHRIPNVNFILIGARTSYSERLFAARSPDPRVVDLGYVDEAAKQRIARIVFPSLPPVSDRAYAECRDRGVASGKTGCYVVYPGASRIRRFRGSMRRPMPRRFGNGDCEHSEGPRACQRARGAGASSMPQRP